MSLVRRLCSYARGRVQQAGWWVQAAPRCATAYAANLRGRGRYRQLDVSELVATRTSDTVFIFGSGRSLLDITHEQWQAISSANTISLREFPRQSFVRADYHVTGEVDDLDEYARRLRDNPLYANTVFVVQEGWRAWMGNRLIGNGLLQPGARVFRYRRVARGRYAPPSRPFSRGLVHGHGTIVGVVNFAWLMGWKTIVLAGVDLYDKGYFWLGPGETRTYEKPGVTSRTRFTGADGIVSMLGRWRELFTVDGVQLMVLNPRSLLANVLPVYEFPAEGWGVSASANGRRAGL